MGSTGRGAPHSWEHWEGAPLFVSRQCFPNNKENLTYAPESESDDEGNGTYDEENEPFPGTDAAPVPAGLTESVIHYLQHNIEVNNDEDHNIEGNKINMDNGGRRSKNKRNKDDNDHGNGHENDTKKEDDNYGMTPMQQGELTTVFPSIDDDKDTDYITSNNKYDENITTFMNKKYGMISKENMRDRKRKKNALYQNCALNRSLTAHLRQNNQRYPM